MVFDYFILLNRLEDKRWVLKEYGLDEKIDNIRVGSINQSTLCGLSFRKLLVAPNLEMKTRKQQNVYHALKSVEMKYRIIEKE